MAGKPQPLILERSEFRVYLFAQMRIKGVTPQAFAEELGVSVATFYGLLTGDELPSDEVVKKSGLRPVYVMDEPAPEKKLKKG